MIGDRIEVRRVDTGCRGGEINGMLRMWVRVHGGTRVLVLVLEWCGTSSKIRYESYFLTIASMSARNSCGGIKIAMAAIL